MADTNHNHNYHFKAKSSGFDKVKDDVSQTANAMRGLTNEQKYNNSINDKQVSGLRNLSAAFKGMLTGAGIIALGNTIKGLVNLSTQYVENLNLFMVQMGSFYKEGMAHINSLVENYGINPSEAMRYMGFFMNLAQGMGVAGEQAFILSKNMTNLGYDLSSLLNIPIDQAMLKIQSGIAGELEPLRRVGYALSVNTMQEYLDRYSAEARKFQKATADMRKATLENVNANILNAEYIDRTVESLTDAEKVQLRYAVLMDQTILAQGDMSRTLQAPANQLRILKENLALTGMALGNIFIPLVNQALPILIGFAQAIKVVADVVSSLFGFELPDIDWNSINRENESFTDGIEDTNDALDKTKKKLKDLKAPFDELNIFKENQASAASLGDMTGADSSGLLFEKLQEYDQYLKNEVMVHIEEIKQKMLDWLGITEDIDTWAEFFDTRLGMILTVVGSIGGLMLGWKISRALFASLEGLVTMLGKVGTKSQGIFGGLGGKNKGPNPYEGMTNNMGWPMLVGPTSNAGKFTALMEKALTLLKKFKLPILGAAITFGDLVMHNENFREGLWKIASGIGLAFEGVFKAIDFVGDGISSITEKLGLGGVDIDRWAMRLGAIGSLFTPLGPLGAAYLVLDGIMLGIEAIGAAADPAIAQIDILGEGIDKTTREALEPFISTYQDLTQMVNEINWTDAIITDENIAGVKTQLDKMVVMISDGLNAEKNEALAMIQPMAGMFGPEKFAELSMDISKGFDSQIALMQEKSAEILAIYQKAADEHRKISNEESAEVQRIVDEMMQAGVVTLTDSQAELAIIQENIKNNAIAMSTEQASAVILKAKETRDKVVAEAQAQYDGIALEAMKLKAAGIINQEEYDAMIKYAEDAKIRTTELANQQYTDIKNTTMTELGASSKYIDEETGKIKTNWQVFCESLKTNWDTNGKYAFGSARGELGTTKSTWNEDLEALKSKFKSFTDSLRTNWNSGGKGTIADISEDFEQLGEDLKWIYDHILKPIGDFFKTIFGSNSNMIVETTDANGDTHRSVITRRAMGGFPAVGEMFIAKEAGPELVGRIGNRTAVANTDQIVNAVSQGVATAVVATMGPMFDKLMAMENKQLEVYLDGEKIYKNQQRILTRMGHNFGLGEYAR